MQLQPGARLGPYAVVSPLGSGGMGDVYRAQDTRLHRVVAIKTLSEGFEAIPEAIARFEREARAAAALNHPNICTIYDVGTDPPFIAMELLEGETLQQRLARGPLDVMTAVDVTLALCDALEAAHAKGIIHRDIKPGNIFLTPRGPKILDFGLAKATAPTAPAGAAGDTRPQETLVTGEGVAIGTVAYMSPEQLRGRALDARSDLFALGLVIYEMVTGRPAFTGESGAVIAAAILQEMPVLPRHVRDDVPPQLESIILETLEKDPRDRTQSAAELRAALRRLKRDLESREDSAARGRADSPGSGSLEAPRSGSGSGRAPAPSAAPRRPWRAVTASVAVLVVLAGAGIALWTRRVDDRRVTQLQDLQVSQITVSGNAWRPALSPDGNYVVYVQRNGLARSVRVRQVGTDRDVELVAAEDGLGIESATVTRDGRFVDVVRGTASANALWRVPFLGGSPKRLLDNVNSPPGWSPDGRRFAFVRSGFDGSSELLVADAEGRNVRTLASRRLPRQFLSFASRGTPSSQGAAIHPAWSPDGSTIALIGFDSVDGRTSRQAVFVDAATGAERSVLLRDEAAADGIEWLGDQHLIVSLLGRNDAVSQIWLLSYPDVSWSRLTNDVANYASLGVSADRRSIAVAKWDHQLAIAVLTESSREAADVVPPNPFVGEDLAWAGDRLLYGLLSPVDNVPAIWSLRMGATTPEELVGNAYSPEVSRDGKTLVFSRVENNRRGIWRAQADGQGAVEVGSSVANRVVITPDSRHVVYLSNESGVQSVWIRPLDGGPARQLANVFAFQPVVSADGQSIAFVSVDERKQPVLMTCRFADCESRRTFPLPRRPTALQWTPDGRGLAYSTLSNIWIQPLDGGAPTSLTRFPEDGRQIEDFEWSDDGTRLAFAYSRTTWDVVLFRAPGQ